MSDQPETSPTPGMQRRSVLRAAGLLGAGGVGAAALAACGGSTTPAVSGGAAAPASSSSGSASGSGSGSGSGSRSGGVTVPVADVPVGGGKAFPDASPPYVVTQPTSGQFKAFDGTCTHQGCPVTKVQNGHILCPCHGSQFDISTGAPTSGSEARKPLAPRTATVSGNSVVIT